MPIGSDVVVDVAVDMGSSGTVLRKDGGVVKADVDWWWQPINTRARRSGDVAIIFFIIEIIIYI